MSYYFATTLETGFDETIERATEALKEEGFGVLTEIDVSATLRKKLDVDFRPYRILGACNPTFAHRALQAEGHVFATETDTEIVEFRPHSRDGRLPRLNGNAHADRHAQVENKRLR